MSPHSRPTPHRLLVLVTTLFVSSLLTSCREVEEAEPNACPPSAAISQMTDRSFLMGFSTWPFGPKQEDMTTTMKFLHEHGDIYLEHVDSQIPWKAWMNNETLPASFTSDISARVDRRLADKKLLLSIGLLNMSRSDIAEDLDGVPPSYVSFSDKAIEDAYFNHIEYIASRLNPDYLVVSIESNELLMQSPARWSGYKELMKKIRERVKVRFSGIPVSESMTLHNWFHPEVADPASYVEELTNYVNSELDFAAISFYPLFKGIHTNDEFQAVFDFLHARITRPIAFAETAHLAEDLVIPAYQLNIPASVCEQKGYVEVLLTNAQQNHYEFVIWFAFRDYDSLWDTFPANVKDLGKIWRDTGLEDETGKERPSMAVWGAAYSK